MKRRFLCVLLALSMALTLLPPAALAFGEDGSGHNYSKFWSKDKNTHWHICTDEGHEGEKGDEAEHDWDEGTVTMKPTYAEPGERTFTCTVCRQFKTEPIAQLVHHYAEEWSYDDLHHWHACTDPEFKDLDLQKDNGLHTWTKDEEQSIAATETDDGKDIYICDICGKVQEEAIGPTKGHYYDTGDHGWSYDTTEHWRECIAPPALIGEEEHSCDKTSERGPHQLIVTDTQIWGHAGGGQRWHKCTVCDAIIFSSIPSQVVSPLWSTDDEGHWYDCENADCDEKSEYKEHEWSWDITRQPVELEPTEDNPGVKIYVCWLCDKLKLEEDPQLGHSYEEEWGTDENFHWRVCTDKGFEGAIHYKEAHGWKWGEIILTPTEEATGEQERTCTTCGLTKIVTLPKLPISVKGITLDKDTLTLAVGSNELITATITPEDAANTGVEWDTSDMVIAWVNDYGRVYAKAEGTVTITATTQDGGKTATCEVTVTAAPAPVDVTGVTLDKNTMTLALVNGSGTLTATVAPANATNKDVTWASSNTSVATVDANGNVTAVGEGTTTITVTTADGGKTASCEVTVSAAQTAVAVTGVTLNKTTLTLTVGSSETLTATVAPANATNQAVAWSSGAPAIATVDANGKVTAVTEGRVTITVTTGDGGKTATCEVTVTAAPAPGGLTIAFNANGGTVAPATATTGANGKLTSLPTPTRSGYTFDGWFTAATGGDAVNTNTVFTQNTTIYAHWTANSGSGGSGGGGGGGSGGGGSSSSTVKVPVSGDDNSVQVSASVSGTTATVGGLDTKQLDTVAGDSSKDSMVEVDLTGLKQTISTVELPADTLKEIAKAAADENNGTRGLTIKLPAAEASFDAAALDEIQKQASSKIALTIAPASSSALNARQKETVGNAPVFDLTMKSGSKTITDFGGGYATISVPYELAKGQDPAGIVVYYLDNSGNIHACETMYDVRTGRAIFTTGHLSLYFVGYAPENLVNFADVASGAYYYDAVVWAVANGITKGTSATAFSPDLSCTRAQTVTFLWRAAGSPAPKSSVNPFTDVKAGAYYYDAVLWAVEQGITKGTGADTFSPDATVTRGQTVTFLYRAAGSPTVDGSSSFGDVAENAYYAGAVKWAVDKDVTKGTSASAFSPNSDCTRGQIVTFLYRDRVD